MERNKLNQQINADQFELRLMKTCHLGFPTWFGTNWPVPSHKKAGSLKISNFKNKSDCTIRLTKTKALISCADTVSLLFSHRQKTGILMMRINWEMMFNYS